MKRTNGFHSFKESRTSCEGFTLIELLVVFSVIVILSGVGIVSFSTYANVQAVNQAKDDVVEAFKVAKFNAVSSVKPSISQCEGAALINYKMQLCAYSLSCLQSGIDYEVDVTCGAQSAAVLQKKLPTNISFSSNTTCKAVTYNVQTGVTTGNPYPCVVELTGYGNTSRFNP